MENKNKNMQDIISHLKNFGFVFQSSEIYGGLANTWDYGPLGVLMLKQIKNMWWKHFITYEPNNVGLDSKILLNNAVWNASGHLANFSDPLVENKVNNKRYRADHIYEEITKKNADGMSVEKLEEFLNNEVKEYDGAKTQWTNIKHFNLMFKTEQGVVDDKKTTIYLRPETAQGIFINFNNIQRSMRLKLPFGVGQIGKSFRNEVTPGNFIFRTREFEQMELEFFSFPEEDEKYYQYYIDKSKAFILSTGIKDDSIKLRTHGQDELSHYSKGTVDIEFMFPFGWGELMGIANRTDFDLKAHNTHSGVEQKYLNPETNKPVIPYVIEPSVGVDRLLLAIIVDSFQVEQINENDSRIIMKLSTEVAPYEVALLPLVKNQSPQAKQIMLDLIKKDFRVTFDEAGSIGKRYRRQDAIGTMWCITYDYDSVEDQKVTIRNRDTMEQDRILISEIEKYILAKKQEV